MQINARRMSVPWIALAGAIQLGQGARRKKHRAYQWHPSHGAIIEFF